MQTNTKAVQAANINAAITIIASDCGTQINMMYANMMDLVDTLVFNKGDLKGFNMLVGGTSSRWVNNTYKVSTKTALYKLCEADKTNTATLRERLRQTATLKSYNDIYYNIMYGLQDYVKRANKTADIARLQRTIEHWEAQNDAFITHIHKLKDAAEEYDATHNAKHMEQIERKEAKAQHKAQIGQQNIIAQQMIETVLAQVPNKDAMAIRLALRGVAIEEQLKVVERELLERKLS